MKRNLAHECPRVEALSLLLDNEIHGGAREEIESHATSCPVCEAALAEFRELRGALRALPDAGPQVDVAALIAGRLEPRARSAPRRPPLRWHWQLAPATLAGAGVLAMGAYLGMLLAGGTAVSAARPAALAVFSAAPPGGLCLTAACYGRGR